MSATQQRCACGETLDTPVELDTGTCVVCHPRIVSEAEHQGIARKWFRIGVEARALDRARLEAQYRERDDFEDLDDGGSGSLPPSSWWDMSEAERDLAESRQQAGMAGGDA